MVVVAVIVVIVVGGEGIGVIFICLSIYLSMDSMRSICRSDYVFDRLSVQNACVP